jgi:NADPH:quinone reductase-like Zn-dependent oxidoreductase
MKAIQFHEFGGPEVLKLEEVADPLPGPGEAVLRMHSAGVNPTDITTRSGRAPAPPSGFVFPSLLGREGAGVVESLGAGVTNVAVGDEVALRNAIYSYAELVKSPAENLYKLPKGLGMLEASTCVITYSTAWDALVNKCQVQAGQTVLVQGAAGGVSVAAIQIAKHLGATVIGTASSEEKLAYATAQGMDHGVNYSGGAYAYKVKELTGGAGVDAVVDGVGGNVFLESLNCIKPNGRIAIYGTAGGREVTLNLNNLFRLRVAVLGSGGTGTSHADFEALLQMLADGRLKPTVERTWPIAEVGEAQRFIEERRVMGKVAIVMGG